MASWDSRSALWPAAGKSSSTWIKWPLASALLSLWLGCGVARFWPAHLAAPRPNWVLWAAIATGLVGAWLALARPRPRLIAPLLPFFLLGAAITLPYARLPADPAHIVNLTGQEAILTGTVIRAPDERVWGTYLIMEVQSALTQGREQAAEGRLRLLIHTKALPSKPLAYGDRLRFRAWLKPVIDFANQTPSSYRRYLADRSIHLRATVSRPEALAVVQPPGGVVWRGLVEGWRDRCRRLLAAGLDQERESLLRAILMGEKSGLEPSVRRAFQTTGTAHLLVVSGMHLTLVAILAAGLFRFLLSRSTRLCLRGQVITFSRLLALIPTGLYALLAGPALPTWRAFILVAAVFAAQAAYRVRDTLSALAAAALILTLFWPPALFDLGFQLSFVAVTALLLVNDRLQDILLPQREDGPASRLGKTSAWLDWIGRASWRAGLYFGGLAISSAVASLALTPLLARAFNQIPAGGVILNLALVPLYTLLAVPLGLCGLGLSLIWPPLGQWLLNLAGELAGWGAVLVQRAALWPAISWRVPSLNVLETVLAYLFLGGLALLFSRRRLGLIFILVALIGGGGDAAYWWATNHDQRLVATFLDVGQGSSIHLRLPGGQSWLIDGGGFASSFEMGRLITGPALWARKIVSVGTIVLTHPHPDHFKGLPFVLDHFRPRRFIYPGHPSPDPDLAVLLARVESLALERASLAELHRGLEESGVRIQVLWPPLDYLDRADRPDWFDNPNETSLVLKVSHGRNRFLLTADTEARAEAVLCRLHDEGIIDLEAEVLQAGHHGGQTSSTVGFLARVRPKVVVISSGYKSHFGSPHPEVLKRLAVVGAEVWRTDLKGAVSVISDGEGVKTTAALTGR